MGYLGLLCVLALTACASDEEESGPEPEPPGTVPTDTELRVAFIADQGLGPDSVAVLELIRDQGADFVIHAGDFDYEDDPEAWEAQIDGVLGADYPYFATPGNHDVPEWESYQQKLEQRLARIDGASCSGGDLGVLSACRYRGLFFILSGVGTWGFYDHLAFIQEQLDQDDSIWRVCAWHKTHTDMQVGSKSSEVGLESYNACAQRRALIATGHEHSYARTMTLTDLLDGSPDYGPVGTPDRMQVTVGSSYAFVSGIAGKSLRDYAPDLHDDDTWWASIFAGGKHIMNGEPVAGSTYTHGALFIDFHVDGDPRAARATFITIAGETIDAYSIVTSASRE